MSQPIYPYGQPTPPAYPQQPYGQPAPQAPQQAQQPYPGQPAPSPYGPVQQYGYLPPQQPAYGQQPPVPQAPRADPSQINLSAFDSQPSGGGAAGLKFKALGTGYVMTVERDVLDRDVQQDTQPQAQGGAPKFYRDGRPQLVMVVPVLLAAPDAEHPDGRASLYVRSGVRDALAAAGLQGPPKAGDRLMVQLIEQRQGNGAIPKNIYRAEYVPAGATQQVSQPAPVQAPPPPAPVQPMSLQGPLYAPGGPFPGGVQVTDPGQAYVAGPPVQQSAPTQAPVQAPEQPQASVQVHSPVAGQLNLSPEQAAFLARIQGGAQ